MHVLSALVVAEPVCCAAARDVNRGDQAQHDGDFEHEHGCISLEVIVGLSRTMINTGRNCGAAVHFSAA